MNDNIVYGGVDMARNITYAKKIRYTAGMLVISIPKEIVDGLGFERGELVEIKLTKLEE